MGTLVERILFRWKTASVKSEMISGGNRRSFLGPVWEMYKLSYRAIGMHVSSPNGLLEYDK